jgi:hypothetical protein
MNLVSKPARPMHDLFANCTHRGMLTLEPQSRDLLHARLIAACTWHGPLTVES